MSTRNSATVKQLRVAENRHFLSYSDGSPFFYLGDTAWALFQRLSREEARFYLENRARKGFTVIQAIALCWDGLQIPNANGDLAFPSADPARPNEAYFRHVDSIVDDAASLGLVMGMLPTWGDAWRDPQRKGNGFLTIEGARAYGHFLGERYRGKPLIWILGGDDNITSEREHAIVAALAEALREGDGGEHLITFHPRGLARSSTVLHQAEWLDFNMIQSSHAARDFDNGAYVELDYRLRPAKPTVDGEPRYEHIPVGFYYTYANRVQRFTDDDVRRAAYWSVLAGACGFTYGNNNVWQMWKPGFEPTISASVPWMAALDHPGAFQMGHMRRLFESRPYQTLVPDTSFILEGPSFGGGKIRSARASDGSFAIVYSPLGEPFTVSFGCLSSPNATLWWFDPRYGTAEPFHYHHEGNAAINQYAPPTSGPGNDWVLVMDNADLGFAAPGM